MLQQEITCCNQKRYVKSQLTSKLAVIR